MRKDKRGLLVLVIGPSGAGKKTMVDGARMYFRGSQLAVSYTTRARRPNEEHGREYKFISVEEFERLKAQEALLEFAGYADNSYGTPREPVERWLSEGHIVFVELETQGAEQILKQHPEALSIFISVPGETVEEQLVELRRRLEVRMAKSGERTNIDRRLEFAEAELAKKGEFGHVVINGKKDLATQEVIDIILHELKTRE